jgi:hypothetical protein
MKKIDKDAQDLDECKEEKRRMNNKYGEYEKEEKYKN